MQMNALKMGVLSLLVGGTAVVPIASAQSTAAIPVQQVTDMLFAVMEADRRVRGW